MKPQITVLLSLPIFKQGDDLAEIMDLYAGLPTHVQLELYAERLETAGRIVKAVSELCKNQPVNIVADANCIFLEGPESVLQILVDKGLAESDLIKNTEEGGDAEGD